jgi:hypothetical protein
MLAELRRFYEDLVSCIHEMEDEAARESPDRARLADVRWKLSRASQRRQRFIEDIVYPYLLERVSGSNAEKVKALRAENATLRAASTRHVGLWTIENALQNWSDYREASAKITASMRRRMATEKAVLYPLLEEIEVHASLAKGRL